MWSEPVGYGYPLNVPVAVLRNQFLLLVSGSFKTYLESVLNGLGNFTLAANVSKLLCAGISTARTTHADCHC